MSQLSGRRAVCRVSVRMTPCPNTRDVGGCEPTRRLTSQIKRDGPITRADDHTADDHTAAVACWGQRTAKHGGEEFQQRRIQMSLADQL
jgi:hypothetical protein